MISGKILQVEKDCVIRETVDLQAVWKVVLAIKVNMFVVDLTLYNANARARIMHFIERIRKLDMYAFVPIIFITNAWDFDFYLFQYLHCYSILKKPLDIVELEEQLQNALRYMTNDKKNPNYLLLKRENSIYKIKLEDIISLHHTRSSLEIVMKDGKKEFPYQTSKCTLKNLDQHFVMCKRGWVINDTYIREYKYKERLLYMNYCEEPIEVSRKYHIEILNTLHCE